jgi:hypothetical protein
MTERGLLIVESMDKLGNHCMRQWYKVPRMSGVALILVVLVNRYVVRALKISMIAGDPAIHPPHRFSKQVLKCTHSGSESLLVLGLRDHASTDVVPS